MNELEIIKRIYPPQEDERKEELELENRRLRKESGLVEKYE